jgi:type 1 glutamine amidotransferase
MQILVIVDDLWHPARIPRQGLAALGKSEFSFDWIEDAGDWSAECMAVYPLTVLAKSDNRSSMDKTGWMTEEVQAAFIEYVRKGNGLLAVHSGTAEYANKPLLRKLLGGVFDHHPEQCAVSVQPIEGHPLCGGCASFTLQDEHYFMVMDDPMADVFAITRSEHDQQPGAWRRTEGTGRVAVLTPGHNLEVWLHASYQTLLRNAIRWCGRIS